MGNFEDTAIMLIQQAAGKCLGSPAKSDPHWDNLSRMTDQYSFLDPRREGRVDASHYMDTYGYGTSPQAGQFNQPGSPPPGYPTFDKRRGNSDIIGQLLNKFHQNNGQQYSGSGSQPQMLAALASKLAGRDVPQEPLQQM